VYIQNIEMKSFQFFEEMDHKLEMVKLYHEIQQTSLGVIRSSSKLTEQGDHNAIIPYELI